MNIKVIALLMLVMLFATPVLAAITVTMNTPSSGTTYNNLPANVAPVDINFTVADNNGSVIDHNITVTIYDGTTWVATETLVNDVNIRELGGTTMTCEPAPLSTSLLDAYTCRVRWIMPGSATMGEGPYYIDVNVASVYSSAGGSSVTTDTNAFAGINISNSLASSATIQALLLVISMIVFAGLIVAAVVSIEVMGTNPAKTAVALVGAGIIVAVLMSILGIIALAI